MTDQRPTIIPPRELMRQWREQAPRYRDGGVGREEWLMERSAQWGADQELDACCKWLLGSAPWTVGPGERIEWVETLAMCRRPGTSGVKLTADQCNTIRKALEDSND